MRHPHACRGRVDQRRDRSETRKGGERRSRGKGRRWTKANRGDACQPREEEKGVANVHRAHVLAHTLECVDVPTSNVDFWISLFVRMGQSSKLESNNYAALSVTNGTVSLREKQQVQRRHTPETKDGPPNRILVGVKWQCHLRCFVRTRDKSNLKT